MKIGQILNTFYPHFEKLVNLTCFAFNWGNKLEIYT